MISKTSNLLRWFSRNGKRPSFVPTEHKNYNFEQNQEYTDKYQKALAQKELLVKKLETGISLPKARKRILKDINYSIENYQVWRRFDIEIDLGENVSNFHFETHGSIKAKPRDVVRAFGFPTQRSTIHKNSLAIFVFEDRNLDYFQLFDYQKDLSKILSEKHLDDALKEFLESEQELEFRFTVTQYAEKHRFKKYLLTRLANVISGKEPTYHDIAESKFGKLEFFDQFEAEYKLDKLPAVFKYQRSMFEKANKSKITYLEDKEFDENISPSNDIRNDEGTKRM
jgi:hypothetical protein